MKKKAKKHVYIFNNESKEIRKQVIEKIATLITAAFGFVAALAWNDAIKDGIIALGLDKYGPLFYAIIVTALAVLVSIWIGRIAGKANK